MFSFNSAVYPPPSISPPFPKQNYCHFHSQTPSGFIPSCLCVGSPLWSICMKRALFLIQARKGSNVKVVWLNRSSAWSGRINHFNISDCNSDAKLFGGDTQLVAWLKMKNTPLPRLLLILQHGH